MTSERVPVHTEYQRRPDDVLWMMDVDQDGQPVAAHEVVRVERAGQRDEERLTACGRRASVFSSGWYSCRQGRLPIGPDSAIHCRSSEVPTSG